MARILIADPDGMSAAALAELLARQGLDATCTPSWKHALEALGQGGPDVLVLDVAACGDSTSRAVATIGSQHPGVQLVVSATRDRMAGAIEALKSGANDFLMKPFDAGEVARSITKARNAAKRGAPQAGSQGQALVGTSPALLQPLKYVERAAPRGTTVLVRGESGTGKDLVARAIHERSPRRNGPFVKVHCAAIPDTLFESELFGYEKGAFTGAVARKRGRVELARGGTLFFDEIGDVGPLMQVKLLRLLQDRQFERLGGTQTLSADVRFVAATHRDLESRVRSGYFREDLFYRLNVVTVWLPPLRARRGDIPALVRHFAREVATENHCDPVEFDEQALKLLCREHWQGNVRELENFVERVSVLATRRVVTAEDVRRELSGQEQGLGETLPHSTPNNAPPSSTPRTLGERLESAERRALVRALEHAGNNRAAAARLLGVSRRTLYNKLHQHSLL